MYQLGSVLGEGTYGKVYRASNLLSRRKFALKRLTKADGANCEHAVNLRELDMLTRLQHRNVIPLTDVLFSPPAASNDDNDDSLCLIMPRATATLDGYLKTKPPFTTRKQLMVQLLTGLQHIHRQQVIHRDLKPQNLLLFHQPELRLCIADFGLAIPYVACEPRTPQMCTIWYRAPEILADQNYGLKSDIWSLGCIYYELVCGRPLLPYDSETDMLSCIYALFAPERRQAQQPTPKRKQRPYLPVEFTGVKLALHRELALTAEQLTEFNESPGTYDEFIELLARLLTVVEGDRPDCVQVLQHPFFDGYRPTMAMVVSPRLPFHQLRFHPQRLIAVELIETQPQLEFRIKFLALDIIDRLLNRERSLSDALVRRYTVAALYIAEKYLLCDQAGLLCDLRVNTADLEDYADNERYVLQEVLEFRIYRPTLYDLLPATADEADINRLYLLYKRALPFSGLRLDHLYAIYNYVVGHYYEQWPAKLQVRL